jgi:hypothetical protein
VQWLQLSLEAVALSLRKALAKVQLKPLTGRSKDALLIDAL